MGWWPWPWPSSGSTPTPSADTHSDQTPSAKFGLTEEQKLRIFGPSASNPTRSEPVSQKPPTREEQADAELDAFLRSFSTPASSQASSTTNHDDPTNQASQHETNQQPPPPTEYTRVLPDGTLNVHPSALYPRTMSCRAAFDQAFYCQSLGGKFNDIYRFGQLQSCSEQWAAFWFCMRTRTLPDHEKQNQIQDFYEKRDARRKLARGSSEDVWEIRGTMVEKAFGKDPDAEEEIFQPLVRG